MTELDTDARRTGVAAVAALRRALEDAEYRVEWFSAELVQVEERLGEAQAEADELRQKIVKLQGGDSHGG